MNRRDLLKAVASLSASTLAASPLKAQSFTDDGGRSISPPKPTRRILAAGGPAAVFAYAMSPDRLVGWPRALRAEEKPYLHPSVRELPGTGLLTGRGGEVNLESVLKLRPDLILDVGSTAPIYIDLANRVQAATGVPVALLSGRFEDSAQTFLKLGRLIGLAERGEFLAGRTRSLLDRAKAVTSPLGLDNRPTVYLARGIDGLETASPGSINAEIIEYAGGVNALSALGPAPRSIVRISMETLYRLNPEVIITWDPSFYRGVFSNPLWTQLQAVRTKRVYLSPIVPFGWIDRPPSVNRLIGLRWLQYKLHPRHFGGDLTAEVKTFFKDFYSVELGVSQARQLIDAV
jgi:iron complex transport system substrate-binding protein